jgi:hypothetical protein
MTGPVYGYKLFRFFKFVANFVKKKTATPKLNQDNGLNEWDCLLVKYHLDKMSVGYMFVDRNVCCQMFSWKMSLAKCLLAIY